MDEYAKAWAISLNGQTIGGRYRLGRPIGVGGMGAVFEGEHQAVGRVVAVKLLFPDLIQNPETVQRFQREARAAAAIARRGVVDILDFDIDPQLGPYLVMEHLEGESLLSRIKSKGRLRTSHALSIAAQISEALAAVHEQEIIHRDLKPANVFLTTSEEGEEQVKIIDFGISRVAPAPGKAPLTVPGTVLGTPRFMAPEQAACDPHVDHRVDIYATGLILYHALSGVKPFADVDRGSLLVAVIRDGPTPLRHLRIGLPDEVYAVVEQAMARDRDKRFQSAVALSRSIEQVLKNILARQVRPRLTAEDDEIATAIDSRPDSTYRRAQNLANPPTTRSPQPAFKTEAPSPPDGRATISEIPSRRLQPQEPPDTIDVVAPASRAPATEKAESSGGYDPSEGSAEFPAKTLESKESLADQNLRESRPWLRYGSTPSYASLELDTGEEKVQQAPPKKPKKAPPKTLVVQGGAAELGIHLPSPASSRPVSQLSQPSAAPPSSPARQQGRGTWFWVFFITIVALAVGVGGLVLGLFIWETLRTLQG